MKHTRSITRRYTRRKKHPGKALFLIVALIGIALYLALAMGAGAWAYELLFGQDTVQQEQSEDEQLDAETNAQPKETREITETVSFPAMEGYLLCIGTDDAQTGAALCRERGGAGFVMEAEESAPIALALYESESACRSVAQKLMEQESMQAFVHTLRTDAVELRLTALPQRIDGVRDAFSVWQQTVQLLCALWQDVDSSVATPGQALSRIADQRDKLSRAADAAFAQALLSGRSDALDGFYRVVTVTLEEMEALLSIPHENILEVSAGIKYTGIRALTEYQSYIASLKNDLT